MGTLANSKDPDEMQHNAAFHQGLHCVLILIKHSVREMNAFPYFERKTRLKICCSLNIRFAI